MDFRAVGRWISYNYGTIYYMKSFLIIMGLFIIWNHSFVILLVHGFWQNTSLLSLFNPSFWNDHSTSNGWSFNNFYKVQPKITSSQIYSSKQSLEVQTGNSYDRSRNTPDSLDDGKRNCEQKSQLAKWLDHLWHIG